jgi:hypothetical protein
MTEFRQSLRYHQARWREANGHPIGSQPIAAKPGTEPTRLVGSRLPLAYAKGDRRQLRHHEALEAAKAGRQPRDDRPGGSPMVAGCPGTVCEVRFARSPGRLDLAYLNSIRAFDVAFVLDLDDGARGVLGVDVRYHEWAKPEIPNRATCRARSK